MSKSAGLYLFVTAVLIALVTVFAPLEKTLGTWARIVYLHGAWVWVALACFFAAAACGLAALIIRREALHRWSRALGRTGLLFWLTFLPMSLYVMQTSWNGLFLDEPRFRIPLNLAIVGLLAQIGVSYFPLQWTSLANLLYGVVLFTGMRGAQNVLHPDSPVFSSGAQNIQIFFAVLLILLAAAAVQIARWWKIFDTSRTITNRNQEDYDET